MLVVSRKENESISIAPDEGVDPSMTLRELFAQGPILVTLVHTGPRRVRLAIDAPRPLRISRSELLTRVASPGLPEAVSAAEGH